MTSEIPPATIRAYREALYRVRAPVPFTMRVDVPCPALAALHAAHGVAASAFLTACNPFGRRLADAANARRQAALADAIAACGLPLVDGIGEDPSGLWPGEPSLLVLGIDEAAARALGARFDQNAILASGPDAVPRLLPLR